MASFWAIVAGISFSGCRILMQNLKLNTIEITLVGAFVQIVLSGLFVSFCQCHRLWPSPPAGKKKSVFFGHFGFFWAIFNNFNANSKLNDKEVSREIWFTLHSL